MFKETTDLESYPLPTFVFRKMMSPQRLAIVALALLACPHLLLAQEPRVAHKKGQTNKAAEARSDEYWRMAQQEIYKSVEELESQRSSELRRGNAPAVFSRGNRKKRLLALTFDDGPHPDFTPALLDILRKEKIKATFFVIGFMGERYPDLIRREFDEGHQIANHTFSHVTLTRLPADDVKTEYRACSDLIARITGRPPRYCRPPGGDYDARVVGAAEAESLVTVLWSDDPGDYASPGTGVIERDTLNELSDGAIVLLHDGAPQTLKVLPQIIEHAKKEGFEFVTIDELYRDR